MDVRRRINKVLLAAGVAAFSHALPGRLPIALGQSAPSPTAATTTAATAPAVIDPAITLRAPNVPQSEREEAARRLVLRQTPDAGKALLLALGDPTNRAAQRAAARAIPLATAPDPQLIAPLFALIGPDVATTDAAIQALASYRNEADVAKGLIALAADPRRQQRDTTRVSAIRAVGTMPNKRAADILMNILLNDAEAPAVRNAAAAALADMTGGAAGRNDPAAWQAWWAGNREKPDAQFERDLLEARSGRLVRLQNRFDRFAAESRQLLEELYQTAPEKSRESMLLRFLRSAEPETRVVGAGIVQSDFNQSRPIPASVRDQLRAMVADSSSAVRIAVAQALFRLNDAQAFDALLAQLQREPDADVRIELARALVPMRDARVVEPLLQLLSDPSLAVATESARGLGNAENIVPLIQKDSKLAGRAAAELRRALEQDRATAPEATMFRAALVDAMGALKSPDLRDVYRRVLNSPREPLAVRRAALRALGQLGKPGGQLWPAEDIIPSVRDPDVSIRQEAVRALRSTADFSHANLLYELTSKDPSPAVRDEAWGVMRNLFSDPSARLESLLFLADRFKGDPERRIEVNKAVADRLTPKTDEKSQELLASVRQNLGQDYMELARRAAGRADLDAAAREQAVIDNAKQADIYFDLALKHYRARDPNDQQMTTSDLIERRIGALLMSEQYDEAAQFAAASIQANAGNHEAMGRSIRSELERLRQGETVDDALRLIDAVKKMDPPLADHIVASIRTIESELRKRTQNQPTNPQSAAGNGQ